MDLPVWLPQYGVGGLALGFGWMVYTGRLVPRRTHDDVRKDRDIYKAAAETALAASAEMSSHVGRLVSAVEQLTAAQRETLDLVRHLATVPPPDRSAA